VITVTQQYANWRGWRAAKELSYDEQRREWHVNGEQFVGDDFALWAYQSVAQRLSLVDNMYAIIDEVPAEECYGGDW
jgi:hypothetical protein